MSNLSIYETSWIDLVFQHKNKEYGAYQLRKESTKTCLFAFFMGILLLTFVLSIPIILQYSNRESKITPPDFTNTIVNVTVIVPNQLQETEKPILPKVKTKNTEVPVQNDQLVNPEIVQAQQANQAVITNTDNAALTNSSAEGINAVGVNPTSFSGQGTIVDTPADTGNTVVASVSLDKLPEFPGGINKFYTYVGNNFEKPEIDGGKAIRVDVSFVIEKDGTMSDIQVKKDPGYGLGKEAIRVLKSLKTKWSPGMIGSKPVRTAYNLPITVQMD